MKSLPLTLTDRTIKPARLVSIERRDGTFKRIAEAQSDISTGASPDLTYEAIAGVQISAVKHTLGGEPGSFQIVAAHSDGGYFDTEEIDMGLYDGADVNLYIVNRDDPTTLGLMFTGTIQPVVYDVSGFVSFDVRSQSVGATTGYIQKFSPMCRTDLFSTLCGLNADDFDDTAEVGTVLNRFNFTITNLSTPRADGWYNGGVCQTDDGVAFEIANWDESDAQITAFLPCNRIVTAGQSLTLWPGCDKRVATCLSKFNNTANFQGEPHSIGVYAAIAGS